MTHISLLDHGVTPFERLLGHAPEILEQWNHLEATLFKSRSFSPGFLEQIRRALAYKNVCHYCMEKAGSPDKHNDDVRLTQALSAANKFAIDHTAFGLDEINQLKHYFSESEIVELIAFFAFISAAQRFNAVLGLQSASTYTT